MYTQIPTNLLYRITRSLYLHLNECKFFTFSSPMQSFVSSFFVLKIIFHWKYQQWVIYSVPISDFMHQTFLRNWPSYKGGDLFCCFSSITWSGKVTLSYLNSGIFSWSDLLVSLVLWFQCVFVLCDLLENRRHFLSLLLLNLSQTIMLLCSHGLFQHFSNDL